MADNQDDGCCDAGGGFKVEAVVSVDERGQMVLPKDLRERAGLKAGDKLALVSWEKDGEVCCMSLIKIDSLTDLVKNFMGPMMQDMVTK